MTKYALATAFVLALAPAARAQQDEFSQAHIRAYKKAAPAVVYVKGGGQIGSGVVIDRSGIVLTTPTACGSSSTSVTVRNSSHVEYSAKVLGRVNEKDLVVLKIEGEGPFPYVELGDSDSVRTGQIVYALGDSFGSIVTDGQVAMSLGVVSGFYDITEEKLRGAQYRGPVVEISAAVNQNQDGGPVVDRGGRLMGLLTLNYDDSKFTGVAIPINALRRDIERIAKGIATPVETTNRAEVWIGIELDETDDGLVVMRVYAKSPAEKGGLRKGDLIRRVNGKKLLTTKTFGETLAAMKPGEVVAVRLVRDGKETEFKVTLAKKPVY